MLAVVERTLAHHAIDRERELLVDLCRRDFRRRAVAAPPVGEQRVGVADAALAAFDRDIHQSASGNDATERGRAASSALAGQDQIDAERKASSDWPPLREKVGGRRREADAAVRRRTPGPRKPQHAALARTRAPQATMVVERSG